MSSSQLSWCLVVLTMLGRFVVGARACETHFYKRGAYPLDLLAPVTIYWQPISTPSAQTPTTSGANSDTINDVSNPPKGRTRKGKGKEKAKVTDTTSSGVAPTRVLWLKVHPAVFHEVYVELRDAISFALEMVKKSAQPGEPETRVEMADLREKLNVFEIMGPKASQVIRGAFKPVLEDKRDELRKVCSRFTIVLILIVILLLRALSFGMR